MFDHLIYVTLSYSSRREKILAFDASSVLTIQKCMSEIFCDKVCIVCLWVSYESR
uniref:Uncharacterized protein n=1 Tax=Setaria italica TaxID=4555 RepID=K3ZFR2_SETIT